VSITIPAAATFAVRANFHTGLCKFWKLRNARDRNTRRFARRSVRAFIELLRQLP